MTNYSNVRFEVTRHQPECCNCYRFKTKSEEVEARRRQQPKVEKSLSRTQPSLSHERAVEFQANLSDDVGHISGTDGGLLAKLQKLLIPG